MRRVCGYIVAATALLVPTCQGQWLLDQVNFRRAEVGGVRLYGISAFSGYSTLAYPAAGFGQLASPGLSRLGADVNYGAATTVGWQHHRAKTDFSVIYSLTYGGMVRYSDANAFSHSLSFSANRTLGRKWSVSFSGSGQDSTLTQAVFQPSMLSVVSQLPTTFDDLAAAFSIGQFSNSRIASMLTGAPGLESPARSLLLGDRVLSYGLQASLSYAHSSKLSFHFSSFSASGQHRGNAQDGIAQPNYLMPRSTGFNGGVAMNYSLSPRTQLGLGLEESGQMNHYQHSHGTTATASLGRKMGMHWFLRVYGGGSISQVTQQLYGLPKTRQFVGGGSLGVQLHAQTLVASYDRSASDMYGFGLGTNTTLSGSWSWHRRGAGWSVFTSAGQHQMRNTGYASISGWEAAAGFAESLPYRTTLSVQYAYISSSGSFVGTFNDLSVHSVRVSLSWAPQGGPR